MLSGELRRWGLEVVGFDQTAPPPPADLVWLEPCANPFMTFPDLDAAIAAAHDAGARVAVDNTVLSPLLLRPLEHGADFVMHSATKILAGHHDALLGVVSCARSRGPRAPGDVPRRHRDRGRPRPGVAAAARAQDAGRPRAAHVADGARAGAPPAGPPAPCRPSATRASATPWPRVT